MSVARAVWAFLADRPCNRAHRCVGARQTCPRCACAACSRDSDDPQRPGGRRTSAPGGADNNNKRARQQQQDPLCIAPSALSTPHDARLYLGRARVSVAPHLPNERARALSRPALTALRRGERISLTATERRALVGGPHSQSHWIVSSRLPLVGRVR